MCVIWKNRFNSQTEKKNTTLIQKAFDLEKFSFIKNDGKKYILPEKLEKKQHTLGTV